MQRGAVPLLVTMLGSTDTSLREMAAFALGRCVKLAHQYRQSDLGCSSYRSHQLDAQMAAEGFSDPDVSVPGCPCDCRLAQNSDNQAGIVQCGGLVPLLELLESKHYNLQHNAAFAL